MLLWCLQQARRAAERPGCDDVHVLQISRLQARLKNTAFSGCSWPIQQSRQLKDEKLAALPHRPKRCAVGKKNPSSGAVEPELEMTKGSGRTREVYARVRPLSAGFSVCLPSQP